MMKRGIGIGAVLSMFAILSPLTMLAACTGARGAVVEAPVEVAVAPTGKLADAGIRTNGALAKGACALALTAGRIQKSSPGCYLEDDISGASGVLHYPCSGDGPADAEFGDRRYLGRVVNGELELDLTSELDWEDGCRWGTRAAIRGSVARRDTESAFSKLAWSYADHVMSGTGCSGVCTAKSTIEVSEFKASKRASPGAYEPDSDEEDD